MSEWDERKRCESGAREKLRGGTTDERGRGEYVGRESGGERVM